jgi:hypothetical protein
MPYYIQAPSGKRIFLHVCHVSAPSRFLTRWGVPFNIERNVISGFMLTSTAVELVDGQYGVGFNKCHPWSSKPSR